VEQVDLGE